MDLIFAIIPWKIIMRMQMETKEKVGVALAMSMGVLWVLHLLAMTLSNFFFSAAAAAFIKCSSVPELAGRNFSRKHWHLPLSTLLGMEANMLSDDGVGLVIWGNAETAVTLMAASMPMFRSLLRSAATTRRQPHPGQGSERSRRNVGESSTARSSRRVYYNKPRRDLVTMTGSTWTNDSRMSTQTAVSGLEKQ